MTATNEDGLKLVLPVNTVESYDTSVTVPCHLSPEVSAVGMEIRWFKGTDCVCLYKHRQVTMGQSYEDRASLFTHELPRGNVSLKLRDCRDSDAGTYICQVIVGPRKAEITLKLFWDSTDPKPQLRKGFVRQWSMTWTEEEKRQMEKSVQQIGKQIVEILNETSDWETNHTLQTAELTLGGFSGQEPCKSIPLLYDLTMWYKASLSCSGGELPESTLLLIRKLKDDLSLSDESVRTAAPILPLPRLVLLGRSESGKTKVGNAILGREERSETATSTVKQQSERSQGEVAERQVTVVDTPDWFCPGLSLEEVRQDVGRCVRLSAPGPHAFLLVLPVQQSTGEERGMLERMEEIFGERCWRNTMILFLFTDESEEKHIEDLFFEGREVQRLVTKCENRFHCLTLKESGSGVQIVRLLEKVEEMVKVEDGFYRSKAYFEAEKQAREIQHVFVKEREKVKERREQKAKEKFEKSLQDVSKTFRESAGKFQEQIRHREEQIGILKNKLREENDENTKEGIEREIEREIQQKCEVQRDLEKLEEESVKKKSEIEEIHKQKMEEIVEEFEEDIKVEKESNLMKIILSGH